MQSKSISDADKTRPSKRKHAGDVNQDPDSLTMKSKRMRTVQEDEQSDRNQSIKESANGKVQERREAIGGSNESNEPELVQRKLAGDLFGETNSSQQAGHQISVSAVQSATFQGDEPQKDMQIHPQSGLAGGQHSPAVHPTDHPADQQDVKTDAKLKSQRPNMSE